MQWDHYILFLTARRVCIKETHEETKTKETSLTLQSSFVEVCGVAYPLLHPLHKEKDSCRLKFPFCPLPTYKILNPQPDIYIKSVPPSNPH